MKVLVVSYSHTGTCRRVRQALCTQFGWAETEVQDLRPGRSNLRCVLDSLLRRAPAIQYTGPAPEQFDAVVLVAPIWAGRLAGPMRSFVRAYSQQLPAVVGLISVMGNRGAPNALSEVSASLGRSPAVFAMLTSREVDTGAFGERLEEIRRRVAGAIASRPTCDLRRRPTRFVVQSRGDRAIVRADGRVASRLIGWARDLASDRLHGYK
jgi:hypothetical protein